jgi:Protein of unknown function (DUF3341)
VTPRVLVTIFEQEEDVLQAIAAARKEGLQIVDAFGPYASHGLDRALGLARSRLPWVCFVLGLLGAVMMILFQFWTTAISWPIDVGGKPWNSWPAFVPATFEMMVLCAGVGTVAAFIWLAGLKPGRRSAVADLGVTDDRFALVLGTTDRPLDCSTLEGLLSRFHPVAIQERSLGDVA